MSKYVRPFEDACTRFSEQQRNFVSMWLDLICVERRMLYTLNAMIALYFPNIEILSTVWNSFRDLMVYLIDQFLINRNIIGLV